MPYFSILRTIVINPKEIFWVPRELQTFITILQQPFPLQFLQVKEELHRKPLVVFMNLALISLVLPCGWKRLGQKTVSIMPTGTKNQDVCYSLKKE